ncbi:hypothetical protein V6N11_073174 [Hibiscus sabdariffa]|uniref:WAT1-related protein n=2 Tax=Hibiscus sabdariffa TaxID=183260 RepID=A0ABR1ZW78_9ROSI
MKQWRRLKRKKNKQLRLWLKIRKKKPRLKPPLLMVVVQFIFAGTNLMYKIGANDGMSLQLIVVYRFMFASVIMIPLALIFERKSLKKINRGSLGQNFYLQSLVHTSATFVAAMINLAPACTFILAICFKMEKLAIGTSAGKAKVCGTLIGIGGAMVFTFYKGIGINIWSTHFNLVKHPRHPGTSPASHDTGSIGGIMIVCGVYVVLWGKAKEMKQKTQSVPAPAIDGDSHEATEEDKQTKLRQRCERKCQIQCGPGKAVVCCLNLSRFTSGYNLGTPDYQTPNTRVFFLLVLWSFCRFHDRGIWVSPGRS